MKLTRSSVHSSQLLHLTLTLLAMASIVSCSDSTSPRATACPDELSSVTATVSVGSSVNLNWSPACPVALVLIEDLDGADQWVVHMPDEAYGSPSTANKIPPPITYGQAPTGISGMAADDAVDLVPGRSYNLILWKILPMGSTASCMSRSGDACLLAVQPFTR